MCDLGVLGRSRGTARQPLPLSRRRAPYTSHAPEFVRPFSPCLQHATAIAAPTPEASTSCQACVIGVKRCADGVRSAGMSTCVRSRRGGAQGKPSPRGARRAHCGAHGGKLKRCPGPSVPTALREALLICSLTETHSITPACYAPQSAVCGLAAGRLTASCRGCRCAPLAAAAAVAAAVPVAAAAQSRLPT